MAQKLLGVLLLTPAVYGTMNITQAAAQYKVAAANSGLSQWAYLNATLGGRLGTGIPVSAPCFPVVNGKSATVDSVACAAVQQNYTDPLFRSNIFGAYMLVSAERLI